MANAREPEQPTLLAKPPGRRTLLSIGTEPTAFINLSPEFVQAIRKVAPKARQRLVPIVVVGLALAWGTAFAGYRVGARSRQLHLAAAPAQVIAPAQSPVAAPPAPPPAAEESASAFPPAPTESDSMDSTTPRSPQRPPR